MRFLAIDHNSASQNRLRATADIGVNDEPDHETTRIQTLAKLASQLTPVQIQYCWPGQPT
jgi:hypothetical protein